MEDFIRTIGRSALPELLHDNDVALALGISRRGARNLMDDGALGPVRRLGRRLYVTRQAFLASMTRAPQTGGALQPRLTVPGGGP